MVTVTSGFAQLLITEALVLIQPCCPVCNGLLELGQTAYVDLSSNILYHLRCRRVIIATYINSHSAEPVESLCLRFGLDKRNIYRRMAEARRQIINGK